MKFQNTQIQKTNSMQNSTSSFGIWSKKGSSSNNFWLSTKNMSGNYISGFFSNKCCYPQIRKITGRKLTTLPRPPRNDSWQPPENYAFCDYFQLFSFCFSGSWGYSCNGDYSKIFYYRFFKFYFNFNHFLNLILSLTTVLYYTFLSSFWSKVSNRSNSLENKYFSIAAEIFMATYTVGGTRNRRKYFQIINFSFVMIK